MSSPRRMNERRSSESSAVKRDPRRGILLVLSLLAIGFGAAVGLIDGLESGRAFAAASAFRIGIVLFALWLALPTLRKPMSWLPPGTAALCLIGIMAVAAQPRLLVVLVPVAGALLTLGWLVRTFRAAMRR